MFGRRKKPIQVEVVNSKLYIVHEGNDLEQKFTGRVFKNHDKAFDYCLERSDYIDPKSPDKCFPIKILKGYCPVDREITAEIVYKYNVHQNVM